MSLGVDHLVLPEFHPKAFAGHALENSPLLVLQKKKTARASWTLQESTVVSKYINYPYRLLLEKSLGSVIDNGPCKQKAPVSVLCIAWWDRESIISITPEIGSQSAWKMVFSGKVDSV